MSVLQKISDLEKGIRGSVAKAKGLTEILSYVASKEVSYQGWRAGWSVCASVASPFSHPHPSTHI